ncbi:MAG: hypothetical protein Tsb0016_01140 [Sphingomonadales bacterium]
MTDQTDQTEPGDQTQAPPPGGAAAAVAAKRPGNLQRTKAFFKSVQGQTIAGMLFLGGAVGGAYIEGLVQKISPEFFGPSVEDLIEQERFSENFSAIQAKLDELAKGGEGGAVGRDIAKLVADQKDYVADLQNRLADALEAAAKAKSEALDGVASIADFNVPAGRSVALSERGNVLGLLRFSGTNAEVNLNGETEWMKPGDRRTFDTSNERCVVAYMGKIGAHNSGGFDLTCKPQE